MQEPKYLPPLSSSKYVRNRVRYPFAVCVNTSIALSFCSLECHSSAYKLAFEYKMKSLSI